MTDYRAEIYLQDSLSDRPSLGDSSIVPAKTQSDTLEGHNLQKSQSNTLTGNNLGSNESKLKQIQFNQKITVNNLLVLDSVSKNPAKQFTIIEKKSGFDIFNPSVNRFGLFHSGERTIDYKPSHFWVKELNSHRSTDGIVTIPHNYQRSQFNWTLFIGLVSVLILMGLKTYYQKFVNQVVNTLVNFQLADKMLREKNIIVRRAFFMMNLNFVLTFGLFILLLISYAQIHLTKHYFYDYLIIVSIIILVLIVRLLLLNLTGIIFENRQVINEQTHSSYLINKNLGLILLPLVFTAFYTNQIISKIILVTGLILIAIATLYRLIRVFQIILRNGVLFYYAILYLCTLELLPLVIGSKILISMR